MVRAALPHLRASDNARIINVASTSVKEPIPGLILSNSLRAGVAGLASLVAFLCSSAAAYLTGLVVPVDGGLLRGIF